MSLPVALLKITVKELAGVQLGGTREHAYALVRIGARQLGRSRQITSDGTFDLTAEPEAWVCELPVGDGEAVPVYVQLFDDRRDQSPDLIEELTADLMAPWSSGECTLGTGPGLCVTVHIEVTVLPQHSGQAYPRRARDSSLRSAVLRAPRSVILQLTEIKGLYKPGHTPSSPPPDRPVRRAEYLQGYTSEDDQGRVYINRDLDGNWTKDTQLIELTVQVTPRGFALPADIKVKWSCSAPDDPTNDAPDFHREWGAYVDRNDYAAGVHAGARSGDNAFAFRHDATVGYADLFDRPGHPWEAVTGFALSDATQTDSKTTIDAASHQSKVRLYCPNVGGASFIVRVKLDPHPGATVIPALSGIMTMWKRIDVDVVCMNGAFSLQPLLADIPAKYEPLCVQLDFDDERAVPPGAHSRDFFKTAAHPATANDSELAAQWVDSAFRKYGPPRGDESRQGWFFLGAAKRSDETDKLPDSPPPGTPRPPRPPPVFDSNSVSGGPAFSINPRSRAQLNRTPSPNGRYGIEFVEVFQNLPNPRQIASVEFEWSTTAEARSETVSVRFNAIKSMGTHVAGGTHTRIYYWGHDLSSGFTGHDADGSINHAVRTRRWFCAQQTWNTVTKDWEGSGFGVPSSARLKLHGARQGETSGQSPPARNAAGEKFFAGKTIIFTHHPRYMFKDSTGTPTEKANFASDALTTIVHEFAHAFGMPHKCGFWDHQADRKAPASGGVLRYQEDRACSMNYFNHWCLMPGSVTALEPLSNRTMSRKGGLFLCGRHVMEIRRVHLEDNGGLGWG